MAFERVQALTDQRRGDRRRRPDVPAVHRRRVGRSASAARPSRAATRPTPATSIGHFQVGHGRRRGPGDPGGRDGRPRWRRTPAPKRGEILYRFGALMAEHKERLARAMTREMGKVLAEARGDVQEGIDIAFLMAGEGRRLFGDTIPSELPDKWAMSVREPIGVAGIITPWNFPMAIPCWKMMPALVSGNTVVFKPASDTPALRDAPRRADGRGGLPGRRRSTSSPGPGAEVGDAIVGQPRRPGHQLHRPHRDRPATADAGRDPAQAGLPRARRQERDRGAGRRRPRPRHRRDPVVGVRDDRPALHGVQPGDRRAGGRRAAPRAARAAGEGAPLGSGLEPTTDVGPLINAAALHKVAGYIEIGRREGELVTGGGAASGAGLEHGHFFEPTIFAGVEPMDRIAQEEIFGPVLSVIPVDDYQAAVTALNQIRYGLSSAIFTRDVNTAFRAMRDFETGIVYVNAGTIGAETHLPVRRHEGDRQRPSRGRPRGARHVHRVEVDLRRLLGPPPARPDRQPAGLSLRAQVDLEPLAGAPTTDLGALVDPGEANQQVWPLRKLERAGRPRACTKLTLERRSPKPCGGLIWRPGARIRPGLSRRMRHPAGHGRARVSLARPNCEGGRST